MERLCTVLDTVEQLYESLADADTAATEREDDSESTTTTESDDENDAHSAVVGTLRQVQVLGPEWTPTR